ncbi:hypothetical protein RJ639_027729 [Escallonia herrerae]|uniref:Uncharacterized protein n=1 Tax=Escallonia herrerae TaxID=1293975 RepID=A0AA89BEV2_9ASTE|nr:hypothetical protein RJ639_027729 [Escallonia herrerae]
MGSFEEQVKVRAKELKSFFKKSAKVVGESCKKGWYKLYNLRNIRVTAHQAATLDQFLRDVLSIMKRSNLI